MQAAFNKPQLKPFVLILLIASVMAVPNVLAQAKKFQRCADLNEVYPHGVGRPGAKDKVSASKPIPVTNFTVNAAVYEANRKKLDRDNDGIACERL